MSITLPEFALVGLLSAGPAQSAAISGLFAAGEVLSLSDFVRLVSSGPPTAASRLSTNSAEEAAWQALLAVAGQRLRCGLLTVIDAPLLSNARRADMVRLAREHDVQAVLLALETSSNRKEQQQLSRLLGPELTVGTPPKHLLKEGFEGLWRVQEGQNTRIVRRPLPLELRLDGAALDCIGDVHGCLDELRELLQLLGYQLDEHSAYHPQGRKLAFVGDLTDRGPDSAGVLRLVMQLAKAGAALCVAGNHDDRLLRALRGGNVSREHGLAGTLEELAQQGAAFTEEVRAFLEALPPYLVLDGDGNKGGPLVIAHAGLSAYYQGRISKRVRHFTLYGDVGGIAADGLPIRRNWAAKYQGAARVVYGHTPVTKATWVNGTINIDTGCAFGGSLTALRLPEGEVLSVAARREYAPPSRPFVVPEGGDDR